MIERRVKSEIVASLTKFPVVGLVGARQVGKTTLAREIAAEMGERAVYLDLERPSDLAKLADPELYLERYADVLVVLDEIQHRPDLFPVLRAIVDARRRNGRFLILGSASPVLLRQSSESLAGRIVYHEMGPFALSEIDPTRSAIMKLWRRGGFPDSFLARNDPDAARWRESFIQTYLERDIPSFGIRVPPTALRRFWRMLAHDHGQLWNAVKVATSMGVSAPSVRHYLDILTDTFIVRQLPPYAGNLKKRLVKAPKIYVRDSGILHSLLNLESPDEMLGHPIVGASWEGWVVEQVASLIPRNWPLSFYRTGAGAEVDLVVERSGGKRPLAIEIKYGTQPSLSRGFWSAIEDLNVAEAMVVCLATEQYPLAKNVNVVPIEKLAGYFE